LKDITASIKAELKNVSSSLKLNYNFILQLYFQERFLYRLSISEYKNKFILKGGLLIFISWKELFRMTKDIDLLGKNIPNDLENIKSIFNEIISIPVNDGIIFNSDSIAAVFN